LGYCWRRWATSGGREGDRETEEVGTEGGGEEMVGEGGGRGEEEEGKHTQPRRKSMTALVC
jgi:hypothetical protein